MADGTPTAFALAGRLPLARMHAADGGPRAVARREAVRGAQHGGARSLRSPFTILPTGAQAALTVADQGGWSVPVQGVPLSKRRLATSIIRALLLPLVLSAASASPAAAQTPAAPANGERVSGDDVVLRWTLEPGWRTQCVQWAVRPETSYAGGPFLAPDATECDLGPQDLAYLLDELEVGRYYWHVKAAREVCDDSEFDDCRYDEAWGPTAYFDSVEPPPPPRPTGCSAQAAAVVADEFILPYANKHYARYYKGITGWSPSAPVCRDLDGDGDREMIVRLLCCTGGSLSPWAIFTHDASGQWRMAYAQVRDTVFRLSVRRHRVRTMLPAPYEGACTRYVRYREVRWSASRFRSHITRRSRLRRKGC